MAFYSLCRTVSLPAQLSMSMAAEYLARSRIMSIVQNPSSHSISDAMHSLESADHTSQTRSEIDPSMSVIDAIYSRRSVRGYLDKEVPADVLNRIF